MSRRRCIFQSTLPTRGSDDCPSVISDSTKSFQSTLPTRGSDSPTSTKSSTWSNFNPRSPRGGATQRQQRFQYQPQVFQSTLPTRGSDLFVNRRSCANAYFNPRSPRGGATTPVSTIATLAAISIHAPHEGERHFLGYINLWKFGFQSTLPTRGSDWCISSRSQAAPHFNPRSPRGGATGRFNRRNPRADDFNPRSPRGGATARGGNL